MLKFVNSVNFSWKLWKWVYLIFMVVDNIAFSN